MEIQLKNIGMIKEANVKIDGLTVIAGENDTGKSTVGKLLFSIIKAISRYKEDLEEDKEAKIFRLIEKSYFEFRREIDFSENMQLREVLYPPDLRREIERGNIELAINSRLENISRLREKYLRSDGNENDLINILKKIESRLLEIKKLIDKKENIIDAQKGAFKKVLISEFKGTISNQDFLDGFSTIRMTDGKNSLLDIVIQKNKIKDFNVFDEIIFNDATFIETPILLQMSELIERSKTYFEDLDRDERVPFSRVPNTVLHIKDFDSKVRESAYYIDDLFDFMKNTEMKNAFSIIESIIHGNMKYDKKKRDFSYVSKGKVFNSINTATGIKVFGIIQMLIKTNFIAQQSLLILDEPEVHLHPKWQLKYAELIVGLVKSGITVLVNSHSPYMIEALQRYGEKENLQDKTNFYLAEDGYIEDKNKLQEIYEKLSEPYDEFDKMDSDILNGK